MARVILAPLVMQMVSDLLRWSLICGCTMHFSSAAKKQLRFLSYLIMDIFCIFMSVNSIGMVRFKMLPIGFIAFLAAKVHSASLPITCQSLYSYSYIQSIVYVCACVCIYMCIIYAGTKHNSLVM